MIGKHTAQVFEKVAVGGEFEKKSVGLSLVVKWGCTRKTSSAKLTGGTGGLEVKGEVQYVGFKSSKVLAGHELHVAGRQYLITDVNTEHPNLMVVTCEVI